MPERRDEVLALLALSRTKGIAHERLRRLCSRFGSARGALDAPDWGEAWGRPGAAEFAWAEDQWQRLDRESGRFLDLADEGYPELLRQIPSPPPLLFVLGPDALAGPNVAIVGPRKASEYGLQLASELARGLAAAGVCIVSGLAYGVDGAAHSAALEAGGRTIAVLGCGVDVSYPRAHTGLYRRIRETGAIVSEFPMGAQPERGSFPRRNRIISGLSLGVVIVEAPAKSGSLITVSHAVEQDREVFAVPGDVRLGLSAGCHRLIKEGAKLVEGVDDVLEELAGWAVQAPQAVPAPDLPPEDQRVYGLLGREPRHIDELVQDSTLPHGALLDALLRLELDGLIEQLAGKRFLRRAG